MTPERLQELQRAAVEARAAAREAEAAFHAALREARQTQSLGQIAAVLGVTRGRIHQLTRDKK